MKNPSPNKRALARVFNDFVEWFGYAWRLLMPFMAVLILASLIGAAMNHPRLIARIAIASSIAAVALFFVRLIEEKRGDQ